jgi:mannosyltransferase OCH1-like enzyme
LPPRFRLIPAASTSIWLIAHIYDQATRPEEVAKVILRAARSDNPDVRYVVGNDAMQMINTRNRISDLEFEGFIKQQFLAH